MLCFSFEANSELPRCATSCTNGDYARFLQMLVVGDREGRHDMPAIAVHVNQFGEDHE